MRLYSDDHKHNAFRESVTVYMTAIVSFLLACDTQLLAVPLVEVKQCREYRIPRFMADEDLPVCSSRLCSSCRCVSALSER